MMLIALNLLYDQIYIRPCWAHILPLCHLLMFFCGMNPDPIVKSDHKTSPAGDSFRDHLPFIPKRWRSPFQPLILGHFFHHLRKKSD